MNLEDLPCGSDVKTSAYNTGDLSLIPGSGTSSGERNGTPLQYSCLENPMEEPNRFSPWGRKESDTIERIHSLTYRHLSNESPRNHCCKYHFEIFFKYVTFKRILLFWYLFLIF